MTSLIFRQGGIAPESLNEPDRTIDVVWSTGAGVLRVDPWSGESYTEQLLLSQNAVRLDRLNAGAPLLDNHASYSIGNQIGVVVRAWIERGLGMATIKISDRPEMASVWNDIKTGILKNISIGYRVFAWDESSKTGGIIRQAVDWEPYEFSLVPIPADAGAQIRSFTKDNIMPEAIQSDAVQTPLPAVTGRAISLNEIRTRSQAAGLDADAINELMVTHETTPFTREALGDNLIKRVLEKQSPVHTNPRISVGEDFNAPTERCRRMQDALVTRAVGGRPTEQAREYMTMPLIGMADEILRLRGERTNLMSRDEIMSRAFNTTSDFPDLLTGTGNRVLMDAYEVYQSPLKKIAREGSAKDFRPMSNLRLSEMPKLLLVNEHGEVTQGTRGESKQTYSIATYARIFSLTRQAIINDDLGAFTDWSRAMGEASANFEADFLAALVFGDGANLADGYALFNAANHANKAASGTDITIPALGAGRQAMRDQKGLDGTTPVNASPRFLLVGSAKETVAEQNISVLNPSQASNANPFSGRLELLVEPRMTGNSWRLFTDPKQLAVLEYAYLADAAGPQFKIEDGFDVMGTKFRVSLDFGGGLLDHRGAYLNPGA